MDDKTIADVLNADWLPGAKAHIGITIGNIVVRWGPYEPEQAGQFITRMVEADPDNKIPFFVGLQCDPLDDLVAAILAMDWIPREEFEKRAAEEEDCGCKDGEHGDDCPNHPDKEG